MKMYLLETIIQKKSLYYSLITEWVQKQFRDFEIHIPNEMVESVTDLQEDDTNAQISFIDWCKSCNEEYVLLWDVNWMPCRRTLFFTESGQPILDYCDELAEYSGIPEGLVTGVKKEITKSFRTGHLLVKTDFLRELMQDIEAAGTRQGEHGKFNLFELYGNYVLHKHPETYVFREWHTFRQGADLLEPNEVTEHLVDWLEQNYDAVSFEPGHSVRDDNKGLMSNPVYHERLTPAQLVQAVQGEYQVSVRIGEDSGFLSAIDLIALYRDRKSGREWCDFERLGDELVEINQQQAWLSWQHAAYLCESTTEKERIRKKMDVLGIVVPAVAIVIVSYNARRLMQECIESIRRHSGVDEYSIIVVDNASTDGVREYLKKQSDIRVQLNDENTGFPVACNQGIALAPEGEDIFFLNNDTRMTHNALYWLRMGLYSSHDTGASGGVSNYAGIGQRLELLLATAENYEAYGRIKNVQLPAPYEEAKILCGFAMLVRRECIDRYGGMDEAFSPGYYEDTDLSLRLRQKGYRLKICRNSFIYHAGGLNFKKRPDLDEINDRNLLYLAQKWGTDFMD